MLMCMNYSHFSNQSCFCFYSWACLLTNRIFQESFIACMVQFHKRRSFWLVETCLHIASATETVENVTKNVSYMEQNSKDMRGVRAVCYVVFVRALVLCLLKLVSSLLSDVFTACTVINGQLSSSQYKQPLFCILSHAQSWAQLQSSHFSHILAATLGLIYHDSFKCWACTHHSL